MILDLTEVPVIDFTITRALDDIILNSIETDREVLQLGTRERVRNMLEKQEVLTRFKDNQIFTKRINALKSSEEKVKP